MKGEGSFERVESAAHAPPHMQYVIQFKVQCKRYDKNVLKETVV
jgi:hypothetical protein